MAKIEGTATRQGRPAERVYVRLLGPSGEFVSERYTGDDGTFIFHVVPGPWTIVARAAGSDDVTQPVDVAGDDIAVTVALS